MNYLYTLTFLLILNFQGDIMKDFRTKQIDSCFIKSKKADLQVINSEFDKRFLKDEKFNIISYRDKLENLENADYYNEFIDMININIKYIDTLKSVISKKTFDEIWKYDYSRNSYNLNMEGEYMLFLKSLSEDNEIVKEYYDAIQLAQGISPAMVRIIQKRYSKLDLSDPNIELLISIHYLSLSNLPKPKLRNK